MIKRIKDICLRNKPRAKEILKSEIEKTEARYKKYITTLESIEQEANSALTYLHLHP